jgi:hypothetical protein
MSTETAHTLGSPLARPRLGALSLWVGLVTLAVALPIVAVYLKPIVLTYLDIEVSAGSFAGMIIPRLFHVCVKIAPTLHFAGVILGVAALFRRGDRRLLGLLGVVLNGLALLFFLMVLGFTSAVV